MIDIPRILPPLRRSSRPPLPEAPVQNLPPGARPSTPSNLSHVQHTIPSNSAWDPHEQATGGSKVAVKVGTQYRTVFPHDPGTPNSKTVISPEIAGGLEPYGRTEGLPPPDRPGKRRLQPKYQTKGLLPGVGGAVDAPRKPSVFDRSQRNDDATFNTTDYEAQSRTSVWMGGSTEDDRVFRPNQSNDTTWAMQY